MEIRLQKYFSPVGTLILGAYDGKLCLCCWEADNPEDKTIRRLCKYFDAAPLWAQDPILEKARAMLDEYFQGTRRDMSIPMEPVGTEFQKSVWHTLATIPYGTTISYATQAIMVGNPAAVRAVAAANKANPISIFIPCHRVIGRNCKLTGYSGGLSAKRFLIDLETTRLPLL